MHTTTVHMGYTLQSRTFASRMHAVCDLMLLVCVLLEIQIRSCKKPTAQLETGCESLRFQKLRGGTSML